jgi:hypothetical protein
MCDVQGQGGAAHRRRPADYGEVTAPQSTTEQLVEVDEAGADAWAGAGLAGRSGLCLVEGAGQGVGDWRGRG